MRCRIFTIATFAATLLFLGACGFTSQGDFVRDAVKDRGAAAFDEGLSNAEWYVCRAASIGSIKRRYGRTTDSVDAYNRFCGEASEGLIRVEGTS